MGFEPVLRSAPSNWRHVTLGQVCEEGGGKIQTGPFGSQLHASDYVPVGVPSIMPANIGDNVVRAEGIARITESDATRLSKYQVASGDIIYSRRGDVERRALITENESGWLCGTGCLRVRVGNGADPRFISYELGHPAVRAWIVRHAVGATMRNLNTKILSEVPIVLPSMEEQRQIADTLAALDAKIANNRALAADLEATARAIFKSWFGDFDPVRAKVDGRTPVGMDAATAALFPDELVDSELGEIPKGWQIRPTAAVFTIIGGGTPKTTEADYWGETIPWFSVVDTPPSGEVFVVRTEKYITELGLRNSSARLVRPGITIITARGTVGNLAIAGSEMTFNQSCYGLDAGDRKRDYFVYFAADRMVSTLRSRAHGSVFPTITRKTFNSIECVMPDDTVMAAFSRTITPMFNRILSLVRESDNLVDLRDTLLPRLISGKLRVPEAEEIAEAAAV